jgi:hypothetical protein
VVIKLAKSYYRFRNFLSGSVFSPWRMPYQITLPNGMAEARNAKWPRLKMPKEVKRRLAPSRH